MEPFAYTITEIGDHTVYDRGKPPLRAEVDDVIFEVERTDEYGDTAVDIRWEYDREEFKWRDMVYASDDSGALHQYPEGGNRYAAVPPGHFPIEIGPVRINCDPLSAGVATDAETYWAHPEWVSCPACGSAEVDTLADREPDIAFKCIDCGETAALVEGEMRVGTKPETDTVRGGQTDRPE